MSRSLKTGSHNPAWLGLLAILIWSGSLTTMSLSSGAYVNRIISLVFLWTLAGLSWTLIAGYARQFAIGPAAFFGLGAYAHVLAVLHFGVNPWIGLILAAIAGGIGAFLIGLPIFRLRGEYFALATLVFPSILIIGFVYARQSQVPIPITPGRGLQYINFRDDGAYTLFLAGITTLAAIAFLRFERSSLCVKLKVLGANEIAASSAGLSVYYLKNLAFIFSSALLGITGALYVQTIAFSVTTDGVFGLNITLIILSTVMLGGIGGMWGSIVGVTLLIPLSSILDSTIGDIVPGASNIMYGLALMGSAAFFSEGIYPVVKERLFGKKVATPVTADKVHEIDFERIRAAREATPLSLRAIDLNVSFGEIRVLREVSVTVRTGEFVGLIGSNGAGKTTFLNALSGFAPLASGKIMLGDQRLDRAKPYRRAIAGLGRTFQTAQIAENLSVADNVAAPLLARGTSFAEAQRRASAALFELGVQCPEARPSELQSSELKLAEIARAAIADPDFLLLDEPLAGLSHSEAEIAMQFIDRWRRFSGCGVLIIEHRIGPLSRYVERLTVLEGGRNLTEGKPAEVLADPKVIRCYLGATE